MLLNIGHDIEFYYKEDKFTIINTGELFSLSKYHSQNYQEFCTTEELFLNAKVDGHKLIEIWHELKINYIF